MPVDLAELRRLHEAATTQGAWVQEQRLFNWTIRRDLPSLLDRLEAAEAEVARLRENGLRLVKALDRIDNHACSGEAQYSCRYCSKSGDIAREALEGRWATNAVVTAAL